MSKKQDQFTPPPPVQPQFAQATPVPVVLQQQTSLTAAGAIIGQDVIILNLPVGDTSGLVFDTSMRVTQVLPGTDTVLQLPDRSVVIGYYFSSLKLPSLEISNLSDVNRLRQLLASNQQVQSRQIVLTRQAPLLNTTAGCLYRHDLPSGMNTTQLGIVLHGFPPTVQSVSASSPLAGKLHPGQTVDALCLPDGRSLTLQSGGFTASRVTKVLDETAAVAGVRQLIVKDIPDAMHGDPVGSRSWVDSGGCACM